MGVMERLADAIVKRSSYYAPPEPMKATAPAVSLIDGYTRYDMPDLTVVANQESLIARLSWVQIAVTIVAQSAAAQAFGVFRRVGEDKQAIGNHPLEVLMQRPNPDQGRFEFLESTFSYHRLTGNAYWWLNKLGGEPDTPAEMYVIPPRMMTPIPDGRLGVRGYWYDAGTGQPEIYLEPWEVVHFKRFNPHNRYMGLSPIEALSLTVKTDLAAAEWSKNFYGEDNAKPQGALAFAQHIPDALWEKQKADIARQHGGTKRNLMLLRGVGDKAVSWVQMGLSQHDMEFLASRDFNKEEIYATFAPGLASMLAINATEANSVSGKATYTELSVWPLLATVAETISNKLLPLYGDNLVCEFEDPRMNDRAMELREQEEFSRTHTIDEIRKERYGDDPIGDDRGDLLPAQIGIVQGASNPFTETVTEMPPQFQGNEQPAEDAQAEEAEQDQGQGDENESEQPAAKAALDRATYRLAEDPRQVDLDKWRKKAVTRFKEGKLDKALQFDSEHIGGALKAAICGMLETAESAQDVEYAFTWGGYP